MAMHIDGNCPSQHVERGRGGLSRARRLRRPDWPRLAGEHRANRKHRGTPHPGPAGWGVRMAAAIHAVLPEFALVAGIAPGQAKTKLNSRQITSESELPSLSGYRDLLDTVRLAPSQEQQVWPTTFRLPRGSLNRDFTTTSNMTPPVR